MRGCGAKIVPLSGPRVEPIFMGSSEYVPVVIPRSAYPGLAADVPTYAAIATVVTRAGMDSDLVAALVGATLDGLAELAVRAPVLEGLDPSAMRATGLAAPLHPGAAEAFEAHAARP
jgi:TRAP-type uncharacterized transport system substrate-binding protein